MRIALVNYRYFISGGPERYMFNIKEILEAHGHEVIPFSVKHNKNVHSEYEHYFLDAIGIGDEVYNHEYPTDLKTRVKVISRMLYSFEAKRKFKKFLQDIKPDIVYILHFQNKMSCSIIDAAKELNIPIVQRISDFGHICTNAHLYHHKMGVCEKCITNGHFQAAKNKCISDSYLHSILKSTSLNLMDILHAKDKVDTFIFPSRFTLNKYIEAGFNQNKLHCIPTFFNMNMIEKSSKISYDDFALYIGRIEKEKGIETLIDAFLQTKHQLKIIGFSNDAYSQKMKDKIAGKEDQIQFLGKLDFSEIKIQLEKCLFTVVPSEWYENLPNTLLESFAFKKAVVATNIGSLPDIVDNTNGFCFEYGSASSLKEKIDFLFENKDEARKKGELGYQKLIEELSSEKHYEDLIEIFNSLLQNKR